MNGESIPRPVVDTASGDFTTSRPAWARVLIGGLLIFCIAGLIGLGVWQLARLKQKLALIDRVDHRIHAEPIAPPGPKDWPKVTAADDEYLRVRVSGHFLNDRETLTQAVTEHGPGYWVMTPLAADAGFKVLVNRGFVPSGNRDPASRTSAQPSDDVTVTGLIRMTEPKGGFLRSNDPAGDRWYSRDVAAIAGARGLTDVAPYFIDADATPNPGGLPVGGLTIIHFPNNHLDYALTWFALAIGLTGAMIWTRRRR